MPIKNKTNQVKTEIIAEKSVSKTDDALIRKMLSECFPQNATEFARCRRWHSDPEYILLIRNKKAVVGHVAVVIRDISCGRKKVRVAGIQSLAVVPKHRGTGLSQALMTEAMAEAWRRKVPFGMLFCVPELERFYSSLGWKRIDVPVHMRSQSGRKEKLPSKNIAMTLQLSHIPFPSGAVDLCGSDW